MKKTTIDNQGVELIKELKEMKKAPRKEAFNKVKNTIKDTWKTTQLILVVVLGLAVIATGIAGIYLGINLVHGIWTYVGVTCGAVTVSTGLVEMYKSVQKVV